MASLQEAIKKGISDADPDARTFARKAYWGFADHFKEQAESLMSGLDPTYKRLLQGEMSQSSSSNSLNTPQQPRSMRSRQASVTGSTENLIDDHKVRGARLLCYHQIRVTVNYFQFVHPPSRVISSGSATLGRKPSSGIPKWSASPSKDSAGNFPASSDMMTRSTLTRQCVSLLLSFY